MQFKTLAFVAASLALANASAVNHDKFHRRAGNYTWGDNNAVSSSKPVAGGAQLPTVTAEPPVKSEEPVVPGGGEKPEPPMDVSEGDKSETEVISVTSSSTAADKPVAGESTTSAVPSVTDAPAGFNHTWGDDDLITPAPSTTVEDVATTLTSTGDDGSETTITTTVRITKTITQYHTVTAPGSGEEEEETTTVTSTSTSTITIYVEEPSPSDVAGGSGNGAGHGAGSGSGSGAGSGSGDGKPVKDAEANGGSGAPGSGAPGSGAGNGECGKPETVTTTVVQVSTVTVTPTGKPVKPAKPTKPSDLETFPTVTDDTASSTTATVSGKPTGAYNGTHPWENIASSGFLTSLYAKPSPAIDNA